MNNHKLTEALQRIIMEGRKITDNFRSATKTEYSVCLNGIESIAREAIGEDLWREAVDIVRGINHKEDKADD